MTGPSLVDWDAAVATGTRLVRPGPQVSLAEAEAVVADLRRLAAEADGHVRSFSRLDPPPVRDPVAVLDRPGWIRANVEGFRAVLDPLLDRLAERRDRPPPRAVAAVGSRVSGAQVGAILAYLASRVLGQYELFVPPGNGSGRLSLVAPNVVAVERTLGVDPHDFRLWVCLHEVTHRTQFTAVPWLREHVQAEIGAYLDATDLDPSALLERLRQAAGLVGDALLGRPTPSLVEAVQSPAQRVVLDRLTAVMSLVEGHGEFVMDGVGPAVVPSVAEIRGRFDHRRRGAGPVDRTIRRLFGLDLKMRQYAEGSRFVRAVVDRVGVDGFNQVWAAPANLPTVAELADPDRWVGRVIGPRAVPA